MPYELRWIPPERAFAHKGTIIYHAYKDNDTGLDEPLSYWYGLDPHENDEAFDIRTIWQPGDGTNFNLDSEAGRFELLKWAIDNELLHERIGVHPSRRASHE